MKFTRTNLNSCLRQIDPESFDAFFGATTLPNLIDFMFAEGFKKALESDGDVMYFLTSEQMSLLLRAYNESNSPGYITFEED